MAIGPIITRGFGSFGSVNLLPTRGYTSKLTFSRGNMIIGDDRDRRIEASDRDRRIIGDDRDKRL